MQITRVPPGESIAPFWCEIYGSIPNTEEAVGQLKDAIEQVTLLHQQDPDARFRIFTGKIRLPKKG